MNDDDEAPRPALEPGRPWPLGATADARGVNFAVFSAHAEAVELCVFDASGEHEIARHRLPARSRDVWHGRLRGAAAGLVYGLRVHGPWKPDDGQRFNPNKLLLDPYAREIVGRFEWRDEHFGQRRDAPQLADTRDNATSALKARVVDAAFDWAGDELLHTPPADTVIYELHVKGFSKLNPRLPEPLRGTYAGLGHPESIAHLRRLGVTALSLLPVHYRLDEERLVNMGLSNHWGYNTIGFFAVEPRMAAGIDGMTARDEFRHMVRALHAAGIEVLLDVVFNHTAESDELGPTVSFRGIDNASYYRLPAGSRQHYENHAGCGNTLDIRCAAVRQMVLDSLRYWVGEMHVDGFRFDLAPVLGRGDHGFEREGAFFTAIAQDPMLSRVKMIAEPWDIGPGGYQVGGFGRGWLEWNDHFRDSLRTYFLQPPGQHAGGRGTRGDFAQRLCGSSDLFNKGGREPAESLNYVVSHDGFSLRDLLSYERRRNEANGENNRDGHGHNLGNHCGAEGPSDDPAVNARRGKLQRALLAVTLFAQGTPMLASGDELGHTQGGNNNPYCQDNPITWIDWTKADADLIEFSAAAVALRRRLLPFGNHWYSGLTDPRGLHDLFWLRHDGSPLAGKAWSDQDERCFGCLIGRPGRARAPLLLLFNGDAVDHRFMLPAGVWQALLDSSHARGVNFWHGHGETLFPLPAHAVVLLAAAGAV